MKSFAVAAVLLFAFIFSVRAQQSADDEYLIIYSLIQQADTDQSNGNLRQALSDFTQAQTDLERFQRVYPDWNQKIVKFRMDYLADKIAALTPKIAPTNSPPATVTSAANNSANVTSSADIAKWQAQLNSLQQELHQSQSDNATLSEKLKEALAAQPAAVNPRELERAREQIRSLMKENDLLKVTAAQQQITKTVVVTNSMVVTNYNNDLQAALAAANQKLADQIARANKLQAQNDTLQKRVTALLATPEAMEALREENALLKKQLAEMKAASTNSVTVAKLQAQLAQARVQITLLQSNVEVTTLEKLALQDRVKQLQTAAPLTRNQKEYEEKIKSLMNERDDLLARLDAANKKLYGRKKENAIAKIDQLTGEVNRLRERLEIDEAQKIPFTSEEAALFKPEPKLAANPNAEKKGISEMPAGSAELVAEAQRHYAAGDFDQAENDYQQILQHDENNGLALANMATIELQQNKLADAEKHINAALAQSPNDAYNLFILGEVKFNEQKYDDALDALSRAVKLDPHNPEIENVIGATLAQKGLRAQAETAFRKAVELNPNYAPAHKNLAVIYLTQTPPMPALARWHYQKALDAGMPRNPEIEKMLADKGAPISTQ